MKNKIALTLDYEFTYFPTGEDTGYVKDDQAPKDESKYKYFEEDDSITSVQDVNGEDIVAGDIVDLIGDFSYTQRFSRPLLQILKSKGYLTPEVEAFVEKYFGITRQTEAEGDINTKVSILDDIMLIVGELVSENLITPEAYDKVKSDLVTSGQSLIQVLKHNGSYNKNIADYLSINYGITEDTDIKAEMISTNTGSLPNLISILEFLISHGLVPQEAYEEISSSLIQNAPSSAIKRAVVRYFVSDFNPEVIFEEKERQDFEDYKKDLKKQIDNELLQDFYKVDVQQLRKDIIEKNKPQLLELKKKLDPDTFQVEANKVINSKMIYQIEKALGPNKFDFYALSKEMYQDELEKFQVPWMIVEILDEQNKPTGKFKEIIPYSVAKVEYPSEVQENEDIYAKSIETWIKRQKVNIMNAYIRQAKELDKSANINQEEYRLYNQSFNQLELPEEYIKEKDLKEKTLPETSKEALDVELYDKEAKFLKALQKAACCDMCSEEPEEFAIIEVLDASKDIPEESEYSELTEELFQLAKEFLKTSEVTLKRRYAVEIDPNRDQSLNAEITRTDANGQPSVIWMGLLKTAPVGLGRFRVYNSIPSQANTEVQTLLNSLINMQQGFTTLDELQQYFIPYGMNLNIVSEVQTKGMYAKFKNLDEFLKYSEDENKPKPNPVYDQEGKLHSKEEKGSNVNKQADDNTSHPFQPYEVSEQDQPPVTSTLQEQQNPNDISMIDGTRISSFTNIEDLLKHAGEFGNCAEKNDLGPTETSNEETQQPGLDTKE